MAPRRTATDDPANLLGRRLKAARDTAHLTQAKVALAVEVERATISQWETGREKPGRESLIRLCRFLGVTMEWLLAEQNGVNEQNVAAPGRNMMIGSDRVELASVAAPYFQRSPQNVPVLGTAIGGQRSAGYQGEFVLNGEVADYAPRPPGIAGASQVFALWVRGSSMEPRFMDGDLIFVHPGRPPRIGGAVLIELQSSLDGTPGPAFVKTLVRRTDAEIVVKQYMPPQEFTFRLDEIKCLYHVLTMAEAVGA